jgi:hypothetical protein
VPHEVAERTETLHMLQEVPSRMAGKTKTHSSAPASHDGFFYNEQQKSYRHHTPPDIIHCGYRDSNLKNDLGDMTAIGKLNSAPQPTFSTRS